MAAPVALIRTFLPLFPAGFVLCGTVSAGTSLLAGLARAASVLPATLDAPIARLGSSLIRFLAPERERMARQNQAVLFPEHGPRQHVRLARQAVTAYNRFLIEYLRSLEQAEEGLTSRIGFEYPATVREALQSRRGLVVCTAHIGNWEVGAIALRKLGLQVDVVSGPQYARSWRPLVEDRKRKSGIRIVGPGQSPRRLLRSLRTGAAVCLLVDGDVFEQGWPARLAGREILLPSGPARLTAASGSLLVGATCLRRDNGFVVSLQPLAGTGERMIRDPRLLHESVARWLEETLRAHPGEWCVFRGFFPSRTDLAPGTVAERQDVHRALQTATSRT